MSKEKQSIHLDYIDKQSDIPEYDQSEEKCSTCGRQLQDGFGLAGGGMGVYRYCEVHGVISKTIMEF